MDTELIDKALTWIEPYWNAEHLRRTLDWLLELEPEASEALRLAAVTHDVERMVPGGESFDPATMQPGEEDYRRAHSERSARIAGDWLRDNGAAPEVVAEVRELIELHEIGGNEQADLLQAADSLSFLEVNAGLTAKWVETGRCGPERARQQHDYMRDRISVERARELAAPLHAAAVARLEQIG